MSVESVFSYMSRLAAQHGAINLGQGVPSSPPPAFLQEAARRAIGTFDQYTPPQGLPQLREAIAEDLGLSADQIVVTAGATEALYTLAESLYGAGDEVLIIEPYFDVYIPHARMAAAKPALVPMRLTDRWEVDLAALSRAITAATRALIITNPYNPTGSLFTGPELEEIVALARRRDLWIISDEVYDELYFDQAPAKIRELAPERVFTVGSSGKRLEATGWRIGWIVAPPGLAPAVTGLRQWASFCSAAPLQAAVAECLPIARKEGFYQKLREDYRSNRNLLDQGLKSLGIRTFPSSGTYFMTARLPGLTAQELVEEAKVAAIPGSAFYWGTPAPEGLFRFSFCKSAAEIEQAIERLQRYLRHKEGQSTVG